MKNTLKQLKNTNLEKNAVDHIAADWYFEHKFNNFIKALNSNSKEPLNHIYSHKEGTNIPKFYYNDDKGNYLRYTNAPDGHSDYYKHGTDSELHPNEPTLESNPEYFTQDGRKLFRAPADASNMEWNPSYHSEDSKNLWAGRWVNPNSGEHEYTYLDSDLRKQDSLRIYRQNVLFDLRLPILRKYIWDLLHSSFVKDQIVGTFLILLDQGKTPILDLLELDPHYVYFKGNLVMLGTKILHADPRIIMILKTLVELSGQLNYPLFSIPKVDMNGSYSLDSLVKIGYNYIIRVLDNLGISLEALYTYHTTQQYSQEMFKLLSEGYSFEEAHKAAMITVVSSMGYDLQLDPNMDMVLTSVQEALIDPIVIQAIKINSNSTLPGISQSNKIIDYTSIPIVNSDLIDRNSFEKDFSNFLHTLPIHSYLMQE